MNCSRIHIYCRLFDVFIICEKLPVELNQTDPLQGAFHIASISITTSRSTIDPFSGPPRCCCAVNGEKMTCDAAMPCYTVSIDREVTSVNGQQLSGNGIGMTEHIVALLSASSEMTSELPAMSVKQILTTILLVNSNQLVLPPNRSWTSQRTVSPSCSNIHIIPSRFCID
jgi:hypothetical protein